MRTLFCLLLALCPSIASAASWDVTIVSATGEMQAVQGQTYRVQANLEPWTPRLQDGSQLEAINPYTLIRVSVSHSLLYRNSAATVVIQRGTRQRGYEPPISTAVVRTPGPVQSFGGTVFTSDGGVATISVTFNP